MIEDVILAFSKDMLRKFHMKESIGWYGWNYPADKELLKEQLITHIKKGFDSGNLIDIALFCAFLWNINRFVVISIDGKDITNRTGKMTKEEATAAGINYKLHPYMLDPEEREVS